MSSLMGWTVGQRERDLGTVRSMESAKEWGNVMAGRRKEEPVISGG